MAEWEILFVDSVNIPLFTVHVYPIFVSSNRFIQIRLNFQFFNLQHPLKQPAQYLHRLTATWDRA